MTAIRAYTTIEQSRKLAKILPLESADMYLWSSGKRYYIEAMDDGDFNEEEGHVRAWSLAALLDVLPNASILLKGFDKIYDLTNSSGEIAKAENPVDACVAMIEKLNELNLL